jgi:hypothetical protein
MRVSGSEPPTEPRTGPLNGSAEDQRVSRRRALLWGLIGLAVVVGIFLYFQYERVLAPLVSS